MAGIEEHPTSKGAALYAGLLQAVALYLVYLALSLTDLWGYMPPMVQVITYGLLALAMMTLITKGLMATTGLSVQASLKAVILSVLLLSMAGILAGADSRRLLEVAVKPRTLFSYPIPEITMTVTPPDYSKREEFTERLVPGDEESAGLNPVPENSEIMVRIENTAYAPTLVAGHKRIEFLSAKDDGFVAHFTLKDESNWQIREGSRKIGVWPIFILEDEAPIIDRADFRQMETKDGLFGLSLDLSDDYGLSEVVVSVRTSDDNTNILYDRTKLAITSLKEFSGELYINLASSDFAGQKVDLILEAVDQAGQKQKHIMSGISLPIREFSNPLSRKIIEIREELRVQPDIRKKLARRIMALGLTPDDGQTPSIYYMALRSAYWRLTNSKTEDDINNARNILWDLANDLEWGDRGQFNDDILALLASLKLTLYQKQDLAEIKKQLQEIDKTIILFLRKQPPDADYNVKELRKIYSKILAHTHYKKIDQAIELISYLEHGFIYHNKGILSGLGYDRFQTIQRARDQVNILEKTQRQIMAFVYKNSVPLELASLDTKNPETAGNLILSPNKDIQNWIVLQRKLGVTVNGLGRTLLKSGIDASELTVAASDLVRDATRSMESGNMDAATGYQSQIMTLLNSLKNILDRERQYSPKGLYDASK